MAAPLGTERLGTPIHVYIPTGVSWRALSIRLASGNAPPKPTARAAQKPPHSHLHGGYAILTPACTSGARSQSTLPIGGRGVLTEHDSELRATEAHQRECFAARTYTFFRPTALCVCIYVLGGRKNTQTLFSLKYLVWCWQNIRTKRRKPTHIDAAPPPQHPPPN